MAIGVPVVRPSNTPDRMRTSSGSCRCVVKRDWPGRRRSSQGWMSASDSAMRGGQPSTTQPIAGPWLSPQVVTRNRWPKLLWDMASVLRTCAERRQITVQLSGTAMRRNHRCPSAKRETSPRSQTAAAKAMAPSNKTSILSSGECDLLRSSAWNSCAPRLPGGVHRELPRLSSFVAYRNVIASRRNPDGSQCACRQTIGWQKHVRVVENVLATSVQPDSSG